MFDLHKPAVWIFGHHHQTISFEFQGTIFQCLTELSMKSEKDIQNKHD